MTAMSHMDKRYWWVLLALLVLTACGGGGSDSDPQPAAVDRQSFTFRLTNLTANQPLSPAALVFHSDRIHLWAVGDSADAGLEVLAESGDPQPFIDGAAMQTAVAAALTGEGVIPPGGQDTLTVELTSSGEWVLTLATMLVNTNDAFAGASNLPLPELDVGEGYTWLLPAYDAGTEGNTETQGTVPGPATGGEGFNPDRDDTDRIAIHPGVISNQDGLTSAALDGSHRWDNPVLAVDVVRTE